MELSPVCCVPLLYLPSLPCPQVTYGSFIALRNTDASITQGNTRYGVESACLKLTITCSLSASHTHTHTALRKTVPLAPSVPSPTITPTPPLLCPPPSAPPDCIPSGNVRAVALCVFVCARAGPCCLSLSRTRTHQNCESGQGQCRQFECVRNPGSCWDR